MKRVLMILLFGTLSLTGCDSSSGSSSNGATAPKMTVSGIVSDPAIKDARVAIMKPDGSPAAVCGVSKSQICNAWSNEEGKFTFYLYHDVDLSGHYLETYGGVDTAFGTNFEGVSLRASLAPYLQADSMDSMIVISPATTLVDGFIKNGSTLAAAKTKTQQALGLASSVDVLADPTSDPDLLKAVYLTTLLAKAARDAKTLDPMDGISLALVLNPGKVLMSDGVLAAVLGTNSSMDAVKNSLKESQSLLSSLTGTGGELVGAIIASIKTQLYKSTLALILDNYDETQTSSANYKANVDALIAKLDALAGNISPDSLVIAQLVKYVAYKDKPNNFFINFANYTGDTDAFKAKFSIFSDNDSAASIKYMAASTVNTVAIPLKKPLGNDNTARVNYYFNSDLDLNHQALSLISSVNNDSTNDTIYAYIINTYAKFGLYDKAYDYAKTYLIGTQNRIKAFRTIAEEISAYDSVKGLKYLKECEGILKSLYDDGSSLSVVIPEYASLMTSYMYAGFTGESNAIRNWLLNSIIPTLDHTTTPQKDTAMGKMLTAQNIYIVSLIENGADSSKVIAALDEYVALTDITPPWIRANGSYGGNPYGTSLGAYRNAILVYYRLHNGTNDELIKDKIKSTYEKMYGLIATVKAIPKHDDQYSPYFYGVAGIVYWAMGKDKAMEIYNIYDGSLSPSYLNDSYMDAAKEIAVAMSAMDGLDAAVNFYSEKGKDKYGEITSYKWQSLYASMIDSAMMFHNDASAKIILNATVKFLDDYAKVYISAKTTYVSIAEDYMGKFIGSSTGAYYARYRSGGYTAFAEYAYELGDKQLAVELLKKAEKYADEKVPASGWLGRAYSAIGHFYNKFGEEAEAKRLFQKTADIQLPADAVYNDINHYYNGLVQDLAYWKPANMNELAKPYIKIAFGGADRYPADKRPSQVTAYRNIAEVSFMVRDIGNVRYALDKAIATDDLVKAGYTTTKWQMTSEFTKYGLVNDMYKWVLVWTEPKTYNRNSCLSSMAEALATIDHFPDSDIAFLDTDGDGKPDFFVPWATPEQIAASGLTLDDDIDGDGQLDIYDLTPFYAD